MVKRVPKTTLVGRQFLCLICLACTVTACLRPPPSPSPSLAGAKPPLCSAGPPIDVQAPTAIAGAAGSPAVTPPTANPTPPPSTLAPPQSSHDPTAFVRLSRKEVSFDGIVVQVLTKGDPSKAPELAGLASAASASAAGRRRLAVQISVAADTSLQFLTSAMAALSAAGYFYEVLDAGGATISVAVPANPQRYDAPDNGLRLGFAPDGSPVLRAKPHVKRGEPSRPELVGNPGSEDSMNRLLSACRAEIDCNHVLIDQHPRGKATASLEILSQVRAQPGSRSRLVLVLPGAHLGQVKTPSLDPSAIRAAIENYVPSVRPGNTVALGPAIPAIATYVNDMHNLIHPVFADDFLSSLDELPASDPLNNRSLHSEVEVVIGGSTGELVRAGLVRSSGVLQFDIGALLSVHRAAPFDEIPIQFRSPDGNAYVHWEFYRNPDYACSTYFAHPFLLKGAPQEAEQR